MRLKNKLTLSVAGVTLAALTGSFALLPLLVRRDEIEDLDRALARQAVRAMARGVGAGHEGTDMDGWVEIPEMLGGVRRHVAIYRADGELLHSTKSFEGRAPRFDDLHVQLPLPPEGVPVNPGLHSEMLRGIVMQVPNSDHVLLYAVSQSAIDHDTEFLYRTLAIMLCAATGLVVLVARWLGGRLVQDVASIAHVARSVARGDLRARIGACMGTTELAALAADVNHMIEQLDTLVAAQQRFVSHAAHELRSPLSTLRGELQLALRRPREVAQYREALEQALLDVEALVALSEDLLTLARVQNTARSDARTPLCEVIEAALRSTRQKAAQANVRIVLDPQPDGELHVPGRLPELARGLRNLLDNAIAHSQPEDQIRIEPFRSGPSVCVAVSDAGPGVCEQDAPGIFEPFNRGTGAHLSHEGGVGLGLAIAREIFERSGGEITLDRRAAQGARFVVTLPVA